MNKFPFPLKYLFGCLNNGWFYVVIFILCINFFYVFKGGLVNTCKAIDKINNISSFVQFWERK